MFWLSTQSPAWVCFGDHVASRFGELSPRRRPKAVVPLSLVTLGSNLGSSLGSPEPPFCLVWSLLSSLSLFWDVSSALSAIGCCNFSIFRLSRTKKGAETEKNICFAMFWLSTQSPAWDCFGDHVASKFGE